MNSAYHQNHPLLQFLPLKLTEWIAKNLADELHLPVPNAGDELGSQDMNHIRLRCVISDRRGNKLHTFHMVEFESDLNRRVMRAQCYPFNMPNHFFHGKNHDADMCSLFPRSQKYVIYLI
jgi:hypothetical protein